MHITVCSSSSSGRGGSLYARSRPDGDHAGLLPGEEHEAVWDRRHPNDPQTATRLNRNTRAGEGGGAVLSAHKVLKTGQQISRK